MAPFGEVPTVDFVNRRIFSSRFPTVLLPPPVSFQLSSATRRCTLPLHLTLGRALSLASVLDAPLFYDVAPIPHLTLGRALTLGGAPSLTSLWDTPPFSPLSRLVLGRDTACLVLGCVVPHPHTRQPFFFFFSGSFFFFFLHFMFSADCSPSLNRCTGTPSLACKHEWRPLSSQICAHCALSDLVLTWFVLFIFLFVRR